MRGLFLARIYLGGLLISNLCSFDLTRRQLVACVFHTPFGTQPRRRSKLNGLAEF
jgi:hypothetical protein